MWGQRAVRRSRRVAIAIIGLAVATVDAADAPATARPADPILRTSSRPHLNADGRPDLVAANFQGSVTAFVNDGSGAFGAGISSASGGATGVNYHVRAGDFDEDGKVDAAVVQPYDNQVGILRGDGTGHFAALGAADTTSPYSTTWDTTATAKPTPSPPAPPTHPATQRPPHPLVSVTVANAAMSGGPVAAYAFNEGPGRPRLTRRATG